MNASSINGPEPVAVEISEVRHCRLETHGPRI